MRRYGEIRIVKTEEQVIEEIARDLLAMLLCIGLMVMILFVAGGM